MKKATKKEQLSGRALLRNLKSAGVDVYTAEDPGELLVLNGSDENLELIGKHQHELCGYLRLKRQRLITQVCREYGVMESWLRQIVVDTDCRRELEIGEKPLATLRKSTEEMISAQRNWTNTRNYVYQPKLMAR